MSETPPELSGSAAVQLADDEVSALRQAGEAWSLVPRARVQTGRDFIDPDLDGREERGRPGERYLRVGRPKTQGFEHKAPGWLEATSRATAPTGDFARLRRRVRSVLLGAPLPTRDLIHERLSKVKALAVLSSDALSSVAYGPEQIVVVFVLAGAGALAFNYDLIIMGLIGWVLLSVVLSYRQTIKAYPKGGGSYIVAKDNLGTLPGLIAAAALMTDYVLTVAVSISSGIFQLTSAFPGLVSWAVPLCLLAVMLIVGGNLRGIRESGSIFAAPTYAFLVAMFAMIAFDFYRIVSGQCDHGACATLPHVGPNYPATQALASVGIFLILQAFASGCSALTGIEAVSDGVPAFKAPEWRNARTTLVCMGVLLGAMLFGIVVATHILGVRVDNPNGTNPQALLSKLATIAFGFGSLGYYFVIGSTLLILVLAANTAFSDFPRLLFFLARDNFAPHQFRRLGERLAFSNGIFVLGVLASVLIIVFGGDTSRLIPLYAIGVFLAFTMSQTGMVVRWWRRKEPSWRTSIIFNAIGATMTAVVFIVFAVVKFLEGAWVVCIIIPSFVALFMAIHRHYQEVVDHVTTEIPTSPARLKPVCIVPVAELNDVALQSLAMARTISDSVIAVHICDDEEHIARLRARWDVWGNHVPLEVLESPYRSFTRPLLRYIDAIDKQRSDDTIIIVLPELVATRWWHALLHNQTALRLKAQLLFRPGTVVISVPYHLQHAPHVRRLRRRGEARDNDDIEAI
ncbi:MAG: APC family permease [Candidatus Dormibacteraeota bacterium]|uniref:APC family permease n=1 Tax=Candidatus Amunia macphersoniae TaxID=3127014 RepID=A0A934KPG5_9BACT|nr:APC family permease [Candidatus Dormibacteraeota bacterium]